ncbi:2-amino-3-ketobutyrate coenzyme A ligase [Herbihabitans rhizosphaerae]|uniref:2-amino-3-ketobutyrate coenzyme A ligase n=1 Tax=Herbihabitans rhizosphaerae TaxID=1872711 RepID=A0A4Q7KM90_9PSEU|nr:glycine C-acetyltransferase [Herbihabitans rhizosphaerae]RZS37655.1 2-amino-3-ketobutyrate coenzyme A ligase [Herbihabitans rhizosphaerae]
MFGAMRDDLRETLAEIRNAGLYKEERVIASPQKAEVKVGDGEFLNFCANNYLGLADHPVLIEAAGKALDDWGFGMASVRFICGTQAPHKELEKRISQFLGTDDTILYSSCFDANGGLFETLLGEADVVISDELNHASIIDGIRLCKAKRARYRNRDMADLEAKLVEAAGARYRLIATDGVFSMDGYLAPLDEIVALAEKYDALVMVDDSHAVGFMGKTGRGTPEHFGVGDKIDIYTGTMGKALGGASGGYTSGRAEIVEVLRQRSRPYLFSNSLAPSITSAALAALDLLDSSAELLDRLRANTALFRSRMTEAGFDLLPGEHAIIPVMIGGAAEAARMADALLGKGIYVIGFSYPVVPHGKARIRTQMSAAHSTEDVNRAVDAFIAVRDELAA